MRKRFIKIIKTILIFVCLIVISILCANICVKYVGGKYIISSSDAANIEEVDCIVVLGCQVINGRPSVMLADRLIKGIELYKKGTAPKIIMSGDHGEKYYDEVNVMKKYAVKRGVASRNIFMDHAGFSTYESLYRARDIFQADKIVIVSQNYHLYRALYIARKLGINAYGVNADRSTYIGQTKREAREILARCKDFVKVIFKPKPTFLGEAIPVSGNGNVTNK